MKKTIKIGVAALLCVSAFALSSCGSSAAVGFTQNWYANYALLDAKLETSETLVYEVSYNNTNKNESYSVSYNPGTYTVQLSVEPNYQGKNAYKLVSVLEISGEYTCGDDSQSFTDRIESESYFRSAKDYLTPVYSKKAVRSTSPVAESASSLAEAIKTYDYTVKCSYADNGGNVEVTYTDNVTADNSTKYTQKIKTSYTLVDNEALLFSLRGLSSSSYLAVFDPYQHETKSVSASFSSETTDRTYTFALGENEAKEHTMPTYTVNLSLVSTLNGKTQTAIYAAQSATGYRNVMLQLTSPLSYSLGSLVYVLKSATFTTM